MVKKLDTEKQDKKPFAFIVETRAPGMFNATVFYEETVEKKVPIKRVHESDPIRYEFKKVNDIVEKNVVLWSVPCKHDYLGRKYEGKQVYTTPIIAIKDLVEVKCGNETIHLMYM